MISLVSIIETNGVITYFNKITGSEMHTTSNTIINGNNIYAKLSNFKNSSMISTNQSDIGTKFYFNNNNDVLKIAFVESI